jgi:hypothetical protein
MKNWLAILLLTLTTIVGFSAPPVANPKVSGYGASAGDALASAQNRVPAGAKVEKTKTSYLGKYGWNGKSGYRCDVEYSLPAKK